MDQERPGSRWGSRHASNCGCSTHHLNLLKCGCHSLNGGKRDAARAALDFVGGDGRECGVVALARANPDDLFQGLDEDFSVANFAGPRGGQNGLDGWLDERLRARHLDLHLLSELEHDRRAAIVLDDLLLTAVPAEAADADSCDAC